MPQHTAGESTAKKDIEALIALGDKKVRSLLDHYKEDEQRHLLVILSRFDFISYDLLEDIFEERIKEILEILCDMMVYGIVSTFGPSDRFFRLDHYLCDYIKRNHFSLPRDLECHMNDVLERRISESNDITEDTSLYLYDIKNRIVSGRGDSGSFLIPSIVVRSVIDIYNRQDYKLVIDICDKVLNDSHTFYNDITYELRYWLCSALCRIQKEDRFNEEIKNIKGADFWFLKGFYQRIATHYSNAEDYLKKALEQAPSMQRAKREMVTVYLALKRYQDALTWAEENYRKDSDNTYHIHAFFRCLIKKNVLNRADITMLDELLDGIKNSYSDKRNELFAAMDIEYQAYVKRTCPTDMLKLIRKYELDFPNSINVRRATHEYKLKQALVSQEMTFEEDN